MSKKIKVLGVCGAQGALLFPLKKYLMANVEPRAVFHSPKEEQWNLNFGFGEIPFVRSLEQLPAEFLNDPAYQPDLLVGSPSCGHSSVFSYSRKKSLGQPREDVCLSLFLTSIKKFKPKIFVMENLPKLMDLIPREEWEQNLPAYRLIVHCHSVIDFGNSQKSRKRLLLVGVRYDIPDEVFQNFSKIFSVRRSKPMKFHQIFEKVRENLNFRDSDDRKMSMYKYWDESKTTLTVAEIRKLWTGKFKKEYKWPMKGHKMRTLPGVYRNRLNAYPLTIRPSSRQFNPDGNPMGLEEFRIIMGFPKRYKVYFDEANPTYWLNKGRNALSKGSVYECGLWIKHCLRACGWL